jgi:flavin reductase (DIM6/NTAB) family NADH-FMN oxidoreductase RutF
MFATGVTVVTTHGEQGPVGVTANSFNSVSLDPPLVLWSLSRASTSLDAFTSHRRWVVNVLAADQQSVSRHFSATGPDDFGDLGVQNDPFGPVLANTIATFWCTTEHEYDGGDHLILVGRVTRFVGHKGGDPLLYFRGVYRGAERTL